jgi:hypothetical protein
MAAKSKNKYDVYAWIKEEVIPSCKENHQQKNTVSNLIDNFSNLYNDYELSRSLRLHNYFYKK